MVQYHPNPPVAIVSDFFLGWTQDLAVDLGVPRVTFWPSAAFTASVSNTLWRNLPKSDDPTNENSLISFPEIPNSPKYPLWQIIPYCRNFNEGDPEHEFLRNCMLANNLSWGVVFNSFTELERVYIDHVKKEMGHDRVWAPGPLLPPPDEVGPTDRGGSSAVPAKSQQTEVLAAALKQSGVHFIWCGKAVNQGHVAGDIGLIPDGFEDRVEGRGLIIRGWAPQVAILSHRAVGAFVSHCGWNSVLEGVAAGVLMLAWPLAADQFTDAKLLVDQLGVAVRVCEGGPKNVPDLDELTRLLAETVSGTRPERSRVERLRDAAWNAVKGGSSTRDLDELVKQLGELNKS
ncbi:hypothetical protein ACSBR2_024199 [Camellia fascicularis]